MAPLSEEEGGVSNSLSKANTHDFQFENWNHKVLGNTWKVNEDGTWYLPERTLGWGVLGWCSSYLLNDEGKPWRFTPEQARFVLWFYSLDDRGRFNFRTGVLQRLKGWRLRGIAPLNIS